MQRPLWASTGTKNPAYSDTIYIDSLIGRDTVNTVPPALRALEHLAFIYPPRSVLPARRPPRGNPTRLSLF